MATSLTQYSQDSSSEHCIYVFCISISTRFLKQVKKIFADGNYLNNWKNDTILPSSVKPNSPITNVSWYAANAYCECQGKRLATVDEWEFVAMANENVADARKIEEYNQYILDWYEKPKTFNNEIGKTFKNSFLTKASIP